MFPSSKWGQHRFSFWTAAPGDMTVLTDNKLPTWNVLCDTNPTIISVIPRFFFMTCISQYHTRTYQYIFSKINFQENKPWLYSDVHKYLGQLNS